MSKGLRALVKSLLALHKSRKDLSLPTSQASRLLLQHIPVANFLPNLLWPAILQSVFPGLHESKRSFRKIKIDFSQ